MKEMAQRNERDHSVTKTSHILSLSFQRRHLYRILYLKGDSLLRQEIQQEKDRRTQGRAITTLAQ
jgi:hypothetical protein